MHVSACVEFSTSIRVFVSDHLPLYRHRLALLFLFGVFLDVCRGTPHVSKTAREKKRGHGQDVLLLLHGLG